MDKESGLPHLAHAATNLLMMLDLACRPPVKIPNFSPKPEEKTKAIQEFTAKLDETMMPEPTAYVKRVLSDLRAHSVAYDVVSEPENTRFFAPYDAVSDKLKDLGLFAYVRSFVLALGEPREEYARTTLGYAVREAIQGKPKPTQDLEPEPEMKLILGAECEAYYWITRCSPESRAYKAVIDPNDWVSLDNTEDNLKFAESLSVMFEKTSTARASTITLHRTPAGHKIRSLLNAKS